MVVRGDSTLMDASSASGCDFSYGVFPSSSGLQARWRSTWASLLLLFGLIVVGICRMVRHSPPATERRGFYDTRVAILLLAMDPRGPTSRQHRDQKPVH